MGTGVSIFLIAIGAILTFAVHTAVNGVDLDTIGVILMVVGLLGMLVSLVLWDDWRPSRSLRTVDDDVIVRRNPVVIDEEPANRRTVTRRVYR